MSTTIANRKTATKSSSRKKSTQAKQLDRLTHEDGVKGKLSAEFHSRGMFIALLL